MFTRMDTGHINFKSQIAITTIVYRNVTYRVYIEIKFHDYLVTQLQKTRPPRLFNDI